VRKGPAGFEEYYQNLFGPRWPALRLALNQPVSQVSRLNPFSNQSAIEARLQGHARLEFGLSGQIGGQIGSQIGTATSDKTAAIIAVAGRIEPTADTNGLLDFYVMDPASIYPAVALQIQSHDEVLDLCAAPGGKSLILAQNLGSAGILVSNELSDKRRGRLRAVLNDYLPPNLRERVRVSGHDGSKWCLFETEAFDKILVDAPCSGERHLLSDPAELKVWSPARSKNLAARQYALLTSALAVVRVGGRIVYSTCALSPLENDLVIARLLRKRAGEAQVMPLKFAIGEPTEHGWSILPDQTGYGPIYLSLLMRLPPAEKPTRTSS
jgi:16S rRNA C967 or C1407 C5-methylase (RsmB/RsmF family)